MQYEIEFGEVKDALVRQGLERAVSTLNAIVEEEAVAGNNVHGTIEGSFRIEADGVIRMYLEGKSALQNEGETPVSEKFTRAMFGKKFSFPVLGQPCMVSWKCVIQKGKS